LRRRTAAPALRSISSDASASSSASASASTPPSLQSTFLPEWNEAAALAVKRWVVFSDLHVSEKTRPVCLEVLEQA
jgi:hypothetical protein